MQPLLAEREWVSLQGEWLFTLDPNDEGVQKEWFRARLPQTIVLPGTTDENRKGTRSEAWETDHLTRVFPYIGAAWYQREINVPANRRVSLFLERTKTSRLWVDQNYVGTEASLVAPHVYPLGPLAGGRHRITLQIHNAEHAPIGDPHQISEHTQTNWNGIIGRIGLRLSDPVWIEDVQIYPDRAGRRARVRVEIGNQTGGPAEGMLTLRTGGDASPVETRFRTAEQRTVVEAEYSLGDNAPEWDEFTPLLQRMEVAIEAFGRGRKHTASGALSFGLRDFATAGTQFRVNGKTTFLRGKVDNCVFPLTGYPPMTTEGWLAVFRTAKAYGLNHYRFHSWCPPEAAFEAADQAGVYLQPELPNWREFGDPEHDLFLRREGERLLRAYGNHPSFAMLSLGNELGGSQSLMATFVKHFREFDPRHLYAQGSNNWFPEPPEGDDYWTSFQVRGKHIRGSYATVDAPLGHIQTGPPSTMTDYSTAIEGMKVPVISHEVGQYQVAPDFRQIAKYTGVLHARNLEVFRKRLEFGGMLDRAGEFHRATGTLAAICYREEIEAALRTPGFGGFQLLDLQDFPGQGTALVGILDSFLESKGLIGPERWREFCSETVLLARMEKYTWTKSETLRAKVEAAHYGPTEIQGARASWALRIPGVRVLITGDFETVPVRQGALTAVGEIRLPLTLIEAPVELALDLSFRETPIRNSYRIWVYPDTASTAPGAVHVTRILDEPVWRALLAGGSVLLLREPLSLRNGIEGAFAPDFWNFDMFRMFAEQRGYPVAPGTLGILCDPGHPAFAGFPTAFHADWQWFHLLRNSRTVILDDLPPGFRPLIEVVDNYQRGHRLGVMFEVRAGAGRLLVSTINLIAERDRPEARQLLSSLLAYMNSPRFNPSTDVAPGLLQQILE